ncbi:MAG: PilZ domain-containing protein [Nitrospinae bacterium]|nr:PilZ domain-containing protein [Nitrospinota bacterium]
MNEKSNNQRQNFRVPALLPLEVHKVPERLADDLSCEFLEALEPAESGPMPLSSSNDNLSLWMNALSQKLDKIIALLQNERVFSEAASLKKYSVSISTSGMSFETAEPYHTEDILSIKTVLTIQNQPVPMRLYGKVVYSDQIGGVNKVAVNFIGLGEDLENRIAHFVLQREQEMLV